MYIEYAPARQALSGGEIRALSQLRHRGHDRQGPRGAPDQLLETGAHAVPNDDPSQRRALFEGAWLALGYTAVGEIEQACSVADRAVPRLDSVASPRSVALLHELTDDLRRRQRNPHILHFLPRLEAALVERPMPTTAAR
jgi:hypothetical protein